MTENPLINVAVVFGGQSSEHGVSCLTAGSVIRALAETRFIPVPIGIAPSGRWVRLGADEVAAMEVVDQVLPRVSEDLPEVVVLNGGGVAVREGDRLVDEVRVEVALSLLHGPFGEDGTIQGMFEMLGIRYVGSGVAASAIGMDKDLMKRSMSVAGLPVGPWVAITAGEWHTDRAGCLGAVERLGYPVFVKPARGGSSLGITRVADPAGLESAIEAARSFDPKVVVEQGFTGVREIEVAVIGAPPGQPRVSVAGEIVVHDTDSFYDFHAKYLPEQQVRLDVPAQLEPQLLAKVKELAARTFQAMDVEGLARVDLFLDADGEAYVNELNTMPGFTRHSMFPMLWAASGLSYPALIATLIELALARPMGLR